MASLTPVATVTSSTSVQSRPRTLAIDLGEDQQAAVRALIEARAAARQNADDGESSFLSMASSLFSKNACNLTALVDRATSLSKLSRFGVVPQDFVQTPDMTFKRLRNSYGVAALAEWGCTWPQFLQLGLDVDDLASVTPDEFRALGVTAEILLRDLPMTAADLVALKLRPHVLRELKFSFEHFQKLQLTKEHLDHMMSPADLQTYFQPTPQQMAQIAGPNARPPRQVRADLRGRAGGLAF